MKIDSDRIISFVEHSVFVFFPLVALDLMGVIPWTLENRFWAKSVLNLAFFNALHVSFTFIMIVSLGQYQRFRAQHGSVKNVHVCVLGLFVAGLFGVYNLQTMGIIAESPWFLMVVTIVHFAIPFHHYLWQNKGLLMLWYPVSTESVRPVLTRFVWLSIALTVAQFVLIQFGLSQLSDVMLALNLIMTLAFVSFVFRKSDGKRTKLYVVRFLFYPFASHSFLAAFAIASMHGIEYLAVFLDSISANHEAQKKLKFVFSTMFGGIIVLTLLSFESGFGRFILNEKLQLLVVVATTGLHMVTYLHFYLDRLLYSPSNSPSNTDILTSLKKMRV